MAKPKNQAETPATERDTAPETVAETPVEVVETVVKEVVVEQPAPPPPPPPYVPPQPRQMRVERQGSRSEPYTRRFPEVRGGVCEFCGIMDRNVPSQYQYKMCSHYRGMELRCSYCPESKDADEVVRISELKIAEHPYHPNELIVWCDSYECSKKHRERFSLASA